MRTEEVVSGLEALDVWHANERGRAADGCEGENSNDDQFGSLVHLEVVDDEARKDTCTWSGKSVQMIMPSALVCGLTEDPVGQRSEGCSAVGDALNGMDGETVLIVRLDGPERGDGIALKDEDEEVGNTQKDIGDIHDVDGEDVAPFDGDAEKE